MFYILEYIIKLFTQSRRIVKLIGEEVLLLYLTYFVSLLINSSSGNMVILFFITNIILSLITNLINVK
jgi:hypothetical protein